MTEDVKLTDEQLKEFKMPELRGTAKDLNEVLVPDKPIKVVNVTKRTVVEQIIEAANLLEEEDEILTGTAKTLEKLGFAIISKVVDEKTEEEEEEQVELDVTETTNKRIEEAAQEEKENVENDSSFEEPKDKEKEEKTEEKTKEPKKKEKPKDKKPKKPVEKEKKERYTRSNALVDSLWQGGKKKELITLANDLYVKNGGSNKPQVSEALLHYVMPTLLLIKAVKEEPKGFFQLRK